MPGALICVLLSAASLAADEPGIGPATLAVVVNTADPQSVAAAHYYVERRDIPLENGLPPRQGESLGLGVGSSLAEAERRLILATLEQVGGNKKRAAEILGISLKTLYTRLRAYRE